MDASVVSQDLCGCFCSNVYTGFDKRNLSAVAAMQYPIPDDAALIFFREFCRSLVLGYPLDSAIAEAGKGIFLEVGNDVRDWDITVLFLRTQDRRPFEIAKGMITKIGVEWSESVLTKPYDAATLREVK